MSAEKSRVEKVGKELIAVIQRDGVLNTLKWMDFFFERAARAELEDQISLVQNQAGCGEDSAKMDELKALFLERTVIIDSMDASNKPMSASANLMRQARISEAANLLSATDCLQRQDQRFREFHTRNKAEEEAKSKERDVFSSASVQNPAP